MHVACLTDDLVISHNAFGYLAQRYGLIQVGITGLTPDEEPKPGDLADDGIHLPIAGHRKQAALEWRVLGLDT
jgi:zinc transport system substrate-binding protein